MPNLSDLFSAGGFLKWDGAGNADADYTSQSATDLAADAAFTGAFLTPFSEVAHVSITGATALTSTAFGKMHVCTGTTADYTVTLPAVSGNAGKHIGVRMSTALTKLVTVDGNGAETIDGQATRVMWAGESAVLYCDGSTWEKVSGRSRPMSAVISQNTNQLIANTTMTKLGLTRVVLDTTGLMADTTNVRIIVKRPGNYHITGVVYFWNGAVPRLIACVYKNGSQVFSGEESSYNADSYGNPVATLPMPLAAADYLELFAYHDKGSDLNVYGDGTANYTTLQVTEQPSW